MGSVTMFQCSPVSSKMMFHKATQDQNNAKLLISLGLSILHLELSPRDKGVSAWIINACMQASRTYNIGHSQGLRLQMMSNTFWAMMYSETVLKNGSS